MNTQTITHSTAAFGKVLLAVSVAPEEIGKRIRAARLAKHWTQLEFALRANVSPASIQRWEHGKLPRVRELLRIAELLEVEPEHLVEPVEPDVLDGELLERLEHLEQVTEQSAEMLRRLLAQSGEAEEQRGR